MSTAELKDIIDQRTPEERKWMAAHLLGEMFSVLNCARQRRNYPSLRPDVATYWSGGLASRNEKRKNIARKADNARE